MSKTVNDVIRELRDVLRAAAEPIREKQEKLDALQKDVTSGMYDRGYLDKIVNPEIRQLRKEIEDGKAAAARKAGEILDDFEADLDQRDVLVPGDITEDAALFNVGVTLTKKDLLGILDRNSDNHTMTILTLRYAKEKGIDLGRVYIGTTTERNTLFGLRDAARRFADNWIASPKAEEMLEGFFPSTAGDDE